MGYSAGEKQLLNLVKINLSEEWRNTLSEYNWEAGSMKSLYKLMDQKLEILFPPLKMIIYLLTSLKKSPSETQVQYIKRVKNSMLTWGVGSKTAFSLNWDRLLIVLILKGLPISDNTLEVSRVILTNIFIETLYSVI